MKSFVNQLPLLVGLAVAANFSTVQVAAQPTTKPANQTGTLAATAVAQETPLPAPQSVFVIPANPKEGRNPFFPRSKSELPVEKAKPDDLETYPIVLNGITSPPKQTAMINGRTFETGETGDVRLQNGSKVSIQCLEIRKDAAVIMVGTQRRELRLRNGI